MSLRNTLLAGAALAAAFGAAAPASAQSTDDIGVEILQLLIDQGVLPREKAEQLLERAKANAALRAEREAPKTASTIDVPYVPQALRNQIRDEVKAEVVAQAKSERWISPNVLPGWLDRVSISGDFRLRYEMDMFGKNNFPFYPDFQAINDAGGITTTAGFPVLNTTINRNRVRYRARLGVDAKVSDGVRVGIRLASGDGDGAVSTNNTLGDYFNKDTFWIDRAFIELKPVANVTLTGGRMPNPFYSTDLVWDPDINPEGVAIHASHDFGAGAAGLSVFATGGAFPLQERERDNEDRWLFAGQAGFGLSPAKDLSIRAAAAYYSYKNVQSRKNAPDGSRLNDFTAPAAIVKGNSVFNIRTDGLTTLAGLASEFRVASLIGSIAYDSGPLRFSLTGEAVKNLAFDQAAINALRGTNDPAGDFGWQVRLDVGHREITKLGDWRVGAAYKRLESDAILDIFADSDFGIGGTDVQGYILEAEVGVFKNTSVSASWFSTDSIKQGPFAIDVAQFNVSTRF